MGDVERLAEVLGDWLWDYEPNGAVARELAGVVLASDWIAAHDAEVAADARREALWEVGEALRVESVDAHDPRRQRGRDLWGLTVARRIVREAASHTPEGGR